MSITLLLTILGPLIFLVFFVLYNKNILKGSVKPSIVTWGLFSLITLINSITYFIFTADTFKSVLAFTDCFVCIVITCLILFKGQYSRLRLYEWVIILLCLISLAVWYVFHSAVYANLLLQPAYILAFLPTYISAWKDPRNENSLIWFMWALSFILTVIVVLIRWNGVWADLINPLIAFCLHAGVGVLALRKSKGAVRIN